VIFEPCGIDGAWLLQLEPIEDERGFFGRTWSSGEFSSRGLTTALAECSLSYNRRAATVRGMHYQVAPRAEAKVVRCIRGSIFDVLLDIRRDSPTFGQWRASTLTAENRLSVYIPEGVAHGFQTLTDDAEVLYLISAPYDAVLARGVRWNDPAFAIEWPLPPGVISARDRGYPDFVL
jgi:dTDP-4-dehydrorhamnose 3,5-epimerase